MAPDFTANNQNQEQIKLSSYRGKKVILYFYPKDNTPGCTGVSVDDEKSHKKFESKFDLPFNLIADTDKKIVEAYGVWGEKSMYGKTYMGTTRKTFVIDEEGKIALVVDKVDTKNSSQQLLDLLNN